MNRLENAKRLAEVNMKGQIELQKNLIELDFDQITEFNQWFKNHPYHQELDNVVNSLTSIKDQLFNK